MALLEIENLSVEFDRFRAVDNVSISIDHGQTLGIVGESGSGKSVSMLALMGLIPYPGNILADRLEFDNMIYSVPRQQNVELLPVRMSP